MAVDTEPFLCDVRCSEAFDVQRTWSPASEAFSYAVAAGHNIPLFQLGFEVEDTAEGNEVWDKAAPDVELTFPSSMLPLGLQQWEGLRLEAQQLAQLRSDAGESVRKVVIRADDPSLYSWWTHD